MIRVENLSIRFGEFQLREISLDLEEGTYFILLGPSGAGKTLLLESILGIKQPDQGRVFVNGRDATRLPPEERGVSYVPQDLVLFPHLSIRDNILFGPRMRHLDIDEAAEIGQMSDLLDIGHILDRRDIRTLSGGEKQRVALARALITHPKVLFMDEPLSSLDAHIRRALQEQLRLLQQTLKLTIFQVTHDHEEAFLLADRIAIMMDGQIKQVGTPDEIYRWPRDLRVAEFLLMKNVYDARVEEHLGDNRYQLTLGDIPIEVHARKSLRPGNSVKVGIRPEEVLVINPNRPLNPSWQVNTLPCMVESIVNLGHLRVMRLTLNNGAGPYIEVSLTHRVVRSISPKTGDTIHIHLRPAAFCVFDGLE